ncbi:hypothetical protein E1B28_012315 [Marasmius oreades]|uniref:Uncharacterized protein n=1 Tax=Marasmius oreades TaxID=181124 RepID=A0A9P7RRD8_9AGAR|nr:uncharacterized protein E1B28_012315 [Marasmius oreades]KAG7088305.1 hypothetical protein E1B28_012315 [Marasmius oreades]
MKLAPIGWGKPHATRFINQAPRLIPLIFFPTPNTPLMLSSISPSSSSATTSTSSIDYQTQWCPVCDKIIVPKRTLVPIQPDIPVLRKKVNPRPRGFVEGTGAFNNKQQQPPRMRTVIDQGPFPLYCSEECKLQDVTGRHDEDKEGYFTYPLYRVPNSPSDVESISASDDSLPSPTDEVPHFSQRSCLPADQDSSPLLAPIRPFALGSESRSKSYHHGTPAIAISSSSAPTPKYRPSSFSSSRSPSSLPNNTEELLSKFSQSFSRRSESRMSLYGASSPPSSSPLSSSSPSRRERPLLPQGAEGKLLVPNVFVRVPSSTSMPSRPASSRRNSSTSINSQFSRTGSMSSFGSTRPSPLTHYEDTEESEEEEFDDPPRSPASVDGCYSINPTLRRPVFETRSYSNDNFRTITRSSAQKKRRSLVGGDSILGSGKRLFLFPTD